MLGGVETTADRTVNHDHVVHFILSIPERNPSEGFKQKKLRITVKIRVTNTPLPGYSEVPRKTEDNSIT